MGNGLLTVLTDCTGCQVLLLQKDTPQQLPKKRRKHCGLHCLWPADSLLGQGKPYCAHLPSTVRHHRQRTARSQGTRLQMDMQPLSRDHAPKSSKARSGSNGKGVPTRSSMARYSRSTFTCRNWYGLRAISGLAGSCGCKDLLRALCTCREQAGARSPCDLRVQWAAQAS